MKAWIALIAMCLAAVGCGEDKQPQKRLEIAPLTPQDFGKGQKSAEPAPTPTRRIELTPLTPDQFKHSPKTGSEGK